MTCFLVPEWDFLQVVLAAIGIVELFKNKVHPFKNVKLNFSMNKIIMTHPRSTKIIPMLCTLS
jgi:hypothetical protein